MNKNNNTVVSLVAKEVKRAPAIPVATQAFIDSVFDIIILDKPTFDVVEGLSTLPDKCLKLMIETGLVFDRGSGLGDGVLVAIDRQKSLHAFSATTLRYLIAKLATFVKTTQMKGREIEDEANVPTFIGETIAALTRWPGMPIVQTITDHPIIDVNNRVLGEGYDQESCNFGRFDSNDFTILDNPTVQDAADALAVLRRLLITFPFATAQDEAGALAAFMTACSRSAMPTAPMVLYDAPTSGSGKGYLAGLTCRLASNQLHAAKQLMSNEDEVRKSIMSGLLSAQAVMFFDELSAHEIDSPSLRTLISAEVIGGRLMGLSKDAVLSTQTFVTAMGNNVVATGDMPRRMLQIRIDPKCENPSAIEYTYKADEDMTKNRDMFVSHVLTIQRAYLLAKGRGEVAAVKGVPGGFNAWGLLCREPILWLTGVDPCEKMFEAMKSNPGKNETMVVMQAWDKAFGSEQMQCSDALRNAEFLGACEESIKRNAKIAFSAIGLGMWLKKRQGQVVDGKAFDVAGVAHGVLSWKLSAIS